MNYYLLMNDQIQTIEIHRLFDCQQELNTIHRYHCRYTGTGTHLRRWQSKRFAQSHIFGLSLPWTSTDMCRFRYLCLSGTGRWGRE